MSTNQTTSSFSWDDDFSDSKNEVGKIRDSIAAMKQALHDSKIRVEKEDDEAGMSGNDVRDIVLGPEVQSVIQDMVAAEVSRILSNRSESVALEREELQVTLTALKDQVAIAQSAVRALDKANGRIVALEAEVKQLREAIEWQAVDDPNRPAKPVYVAPAVTENKGKSRAWWAAKRSQLGKEWCIRNGCPPTYLV